MTIILRKHEMELFEKLRDVHPSTVCEGRPCIIHNPINGEFRSMPIEWDNDLGAFGRICMHNLWHPDPSQFAFWRLYGMESRATHPCDRCCMNWEIESWMFD